MSRRRKTGREILIIFLVFGGLLAIWYLSELSYARAISPREVLTIRDYFERFGEPRFVQMVQSNGGSFYEFTGAKKAPLSFAFPLSPPVYIFDEEGKFVAWCKDPGDDPRHRQEWVVGSTNRVPIWTLKQKFWYPNAGYAALSDRELFRLKEAVIAAARDPETWQRLGAKRITTTPFRFKMADADYHLYFDQSETVDVLIPSGGKVGWHSCYVRASVRRDTFEVVAIEESFWP